MIKKGHEILGRVKKCCSHESIVFEKKTIHDDWADITEESWISFVCRDCGHSWKEEHWPNEDDGQSKTYFEYYKKYRKGLGLFQFMLHHKSCDHIGPAEIRSNNVIECMKCGANIAGKK